MTTTLVDVTRERDRLRRRRHRFEERCRRWMRAHDVRHAKLNEAEFFLMRGLDPDRIDRGRRVVVVSGDPKQIRKGRGWRASDSRWQVIDDARDDLANGAVKLRSEYFGVKNYDAFGDQRTDCAYGMGPRHGSIVFSVGLTPAVRERLRQGGALTAQEVEDGIYFLNALMTRQTETAA